MLVFGRQYLLGYPQHNTQNQTDIHGGFKLFDDFPE